MTDPSSRTMTPGIGPLAQQAYDSVRNAIEAGTLEPGTRVSEYRIAELLSISRTPAREALQRLESEGLLANHARRGLVVVSVDAEALNELYYTRRILEGALAEQASQNASRPEIAAILRLCDAEEEMLGDSDKMHAHNKEFHEQIRQAAHNRYLRKISASVSDIVASDRKGSTLLLPERQREVIAEHRALAEAIAARDAVAAADAARRHVQGAYVARQKMRDLEDK